MSAPGCTGPECKREAKVLTPVPLCWSHYQQARRCRLAGQPVVLTVLRGRAPALRPLRTRVKESTYAFLGATPGERAREILEAAEERAVSKRTRRRRRE